MKPVKLSCGATIRDYHGYHQTLEAYEVPDRKNGGYKAVKRWVFYITGFIGEPEEDGFCHILKFDNSEDLIPIDRNNNITVCGKKFSPLHWNH